MARTGLRLVFFKRFPNFVCDVALLGALWSCVLPWRGKCQHSSRRRGPLGYRWHLKPGGICHVVTGPGGTCERMLRRMKALCGVALVRECSGRRCAGGVRDWETISLTSIRERADWCGVSWAARPLPRHFLARCLPLLLLAYPWAVFSSPCFLLLVHLQPGQLMVIGRSLTMAFIEIMRKFNTVLVCLYSASHGIHWNHETEKNLGFVFGVWWDSVYLDHGIHWNHDKV